MYRLCSGPKIAIFVQSVYVSVSTSHINYIPVVYCHPIIYITNFSLAQSVFIQQHITDTDILSTKESSKVPDDSQFEYST